MPFPKKPKTFDASELSEQDIAWHTSVRPAWGHQYNIVTFGQREEPEVNADNRLLEMDDAKPSIEVEEDGYIRFSNFDFKKAKDAVRQSCIRAKEG